MEHVAGLTHVHTLALDGRGVVAGHVVAQVVEDGLPHLEKSRGRDRVQVLDLSALDRNGLPAPDHLKAQRLAHLVVEDLFELGEEGHQPALNLDQYVPRLKPCELPGPARHQAGHRQHPHAPRVSVPDISLDGGGQPEAAEVVEGPVGKGGLQGAPTHGLAPADEVHRPLHALEGQVVRRGRAHHARRVQRHHLSVRVNDGAPRASPACVGRRLEVESVVVVERVAAVVGRLPVQPRQGAPQDRQLLPGVVAHHPDVESDFGQIRPELETCKTSVAAQVAKLGRVELEDPEVVHRVTVDRPERHLLVILEQGFGQHGPGLDDVAVGQNKTLLGVHHEARRLTCPRTVRVEAPGRVYLDRDD
mmetsp:Transcript_30755/g.69002  ORF Transcript_30755/g.69002 Transcript_30755/m.69002 type:complete len:361 (+) Transcript_30755:1064-2146(+)